MIVKNIYEEITAFIDGEHHDPKRAGELSALINSDFDYAFEYHVQKCVKNLLFNRFCYCNSSEFKCKPIKIKLNSGKTILFIKTKSNFANTNLREKK